MVIPPPASTRGERSETLTKFAGEGYGSLFPVELNPLICARPLFVVEVDDFLARVFFFFNFFIPFTSAIAGPLRFNDGCDLHPFARILLLAPTLARALLFLLFVVFFFFFFLFSLISIATP